MRLTVAIAVTCLSCAPELPRRASLVDEPRVIAVVAEPAESEPGTAVTYRAVVASPDGTIEDPALTWALCLTPKPPGESRSVNETCLGDGVVALPATGAGAEIETPEDACFLFGPDTPPGDARPRDPDATGGFYLPLRTTLGEELAFAHHRIHCNLADAPVDAALAYRESYRDNQNPVIDAFSAVTAGESVTLSLRWLPESRERFLVYDPLTRDLVTRDETLRASWYTTAGTLEHDTTTGELATENRYTAATTGTAHLWVVLRDDRGGVAVATHELPAR